MLNSRPSVGLKSENLTQPSQSGKSSLNLTDNTNTAQPSQSGKSSLNLSDNINTTQPTDQASSDNLSYSDINQNVVYYDKSMPPPKKQFPRQQLIGFTMKDNIVKTDDGLLLACTDDKWKQYL